MTGFVVVIPSRYASTRLPGKPLRDIEGKTMLQHVYERGMESAATDVVIATDDDRIGRVAESFGARVCMTSDQHRSGSERIAEVCDVMDWEDDRIVVNLQGDEPTMPATLINQCAALLQGSSSDIATLASPIRSLEDLNNPNVVKVIVDDSGEAIYFSRAAIPFARSEEQEVAALDIALHHHGIYAYRCGVLRRLVAAEPSQLEIVEQLEQLRALSLGMSIRVGIPSERPGAGVDTEEDLITAAAELRD